MIALGVMTLIARRKKGAGRKFAISQFDLTAQFCRCSLEMNEDLRFGFANDLVWDRLFHPAAGIEGGLTQSARCFAMRMITHVISYCQLDDGII
ncbi:hypothetical protein [Pseudooceanicola sp.]|uniref:hypothetical protein n=1 Tax=Pseudooceanicola sp. TaxID=1914328 RepID=UPI004059880A